MSDGELRDIIDLRAGLTVMKFAPDALWTIVGLSRGLPFFTQTLAKHAAMNAVDKRRLVVTNQDVDAAMDRFIDDAEVSFRDAYRTATRTNQQNNLQESLLACALARCDDEGFFKAADVVEPFSAIMRGPKRIAHFEKHLRRFSTEDGGNILIKRGGERQQHFRFADPMMQPYVIIRGIQANTIDEAARNLLLRREQRDLGI
jgi:hypothetical protein